MTLTQTERSHAFVVALEKLGNGPIARLRRHNGHPLAESADAWPYFYRCLPAELPYWQTRLYFNVATLFALTKQRHRSMEAGSFGLTLWRMTQRTGEAPTANLSTLDVRFQTLIQADHEQAMDRLRPLVRQAVSRYAQIDFAILLTHLLAWDNPDQWVQQRWAHDYYMGPRRDKPNPTPEPEIHL